MNFSQIQIKNIFNITDKIFREQPEVLAEHIMQVYYESDIFTAINYGCRYPLGLIDTQLKPLNLTAEQHEFVSRTFQDFIHQTLLNNKTRLLQILTRENRMSRNTLNSLAQFISNIMPDKDKDFLIYFSKKAELL
ncbi:hypothetical protein ACWOAN_03980 [Lactococcus taiwanensis]|uniref:hypothetical protein n=1 Tax=Lactococcus taiwanensis TaxID=1151742 RepID=UPI001903372A|nr:hypothetical protein [Lactococcus taiwanensis]